MPEASSALAVAVGVLSQVLGAAALWGYILMPRQQAIPLPSLSRVGPGETTGGCVLGRVRGLSWRPPCAAMTAFRAAQS